MEIFKEQSFFYTSDGIRIFYKTNFNKSDFDPNAPILVFNYGLVCNNEHWSKQFPFFHQQGFQILAHDYRCHFGSSGGDDIESCTFFNMAKDIKEILDSMGAKKVYMLGHSMGVNVTLEYARNDHEHLKGIIIISGSVFPPGDYMFDTNLADIGMPIIKSLMHTFPKLYKIFWENSYKNPIVRTVVRQGGFNMAQVSDEFVQTYMKKIGELDPELFYHLLESMASHDVINLLEHLKTPTLLMGGDKDKIVPNHIQFAMKKFIPNSELYVIKDGSHVPQADFPKSVNERILKFVAKNAI